MPIYHEATVLLDEQDLEGLKRLVNEADVLAVVRLIETLSGEARAIAFRVLDKERSLRVFEQLDIDLQEEIVQTFTEERAIETISGMEPDDRARLLDELPAKVTKRLLARLSPEQRHKTADLLGYAPETAGRIMTPEYVWLEAGMTASEALEKLRRVGAEVEMIYTAYVIGEGRRLEGTVTLKDLVLADPEVNVGDLVDEEAVSVTTDTDQERVARILQERDLLAVPVVDRENRLVGVITVDDAMDVLDEETTEDIFSRAGLTSLTRKESVRSLRLVSGSLWDVWRVRVPFLLITLVGGLVAGGVIDAFEDTLQAVAAVAIFIPVIMDMGGNVGTQSTTIFTRALVLQHIDLRRFFVHWRREVIVGLSIGVVLGSAAGLVAHLWQGIPGLGLAVGFSLALTVTLATALGFFIPYLLVKLDFDEAAGSNPIITTLKDIIGLLVYFTAIAAFLGDLV